MRRHLPAVVPLVVLALVVGAAASGAGSGRASAASGDRSLDAYGGLGAWISIYDHWSWRHPDQAVGMLAAHGVNTLFLETSNYRQRVDVVHPRVVAAFVEAAHADGLQVVSWYLPSLDAPARDLRRSLAAARFTTPDGDAFDSFALDIEATLVRSISLRNARTLQLAARLRRAVPDYFPLGAITIAPVGASPSYWPTFPFRGLARFADVFLPMTYFTARTHGAARVRAYTAANVRFIRAQAGDAAFPVHAIGGLAPRASPAEVRAFLAAAGGCEALGASLWEAELTTAAEWAQLAPLAAAASPADALGASAAVAC